MRVDTLKDPAAEKWKAKNFIYGRSKKIVL